jgi:hypothetical protein
MGARKRFVKNVGFSWQSFQGEYTGLNIVTKIIGYGENGSAPTSWQRSIVSEMSKALWLKDDISKKALMRVLCLKLWLTGI